MKLNDVAVRKAKPEAKPYKMADGGGLFVLVQPNGSKYWRLAYRYGGKQKLLALGVYSDVPLTLAREWRDDARKLLARDIDPGEHRKVQSTARKIKNANSFEAVAREWFAKHMAGKAESHRSKVLGRLENDVFPWMGNRPIADIKAPELLAVVRRTESRGALDI